VGPHGEKESTAKARMSHISVRVSPDQAAQIDELAAARGITGRGARSQLVRALIDEAADDPDAAKPPVADERELHEMITGSARGGNVAAMHELRMLLRTPPADAGGRRDTKPAEAKDDFERLDELARARTKKKARGR
jgi:Arc/MetJ-type ribon-helix-helix transcriptional regulator